VWLCVPYRKIPVSRHPPIRAKRGPVRSQQCFCRDELPTFHFRLSLPIFFPAKANRVVHPSPDVLHSTAATVQYCNWHRSQFLLTIMGSQPSTSLRAFPPALLAYTHQKWHRALRLGEVRRTGIQHVPQLADQSTHAADAGNYGSHVSG
jgi:hypothetical protein